MDELELGPADAAMPEPAAEPAAPLADEPVDAAPAAEMPDAEPVPAAEAATGDLPPAAEAAAPDPAPAPAEPIGQEPEPVVPAAAQPEDPAAPTPDSGLASAGTADPEEQSTTEGTEATEGLASGGTPDLENIDPDEVGWSMVDVRLKRDLKVGDRAGYAGDLLAVVWLPEWVSLNWLVDAIRGDLARGAPAPADEE